MSFALVQRFNKPLYLLCLLFNYRELFVNSSSNPPVCGHRTFELYTKLLKSRIFLLGYSLLLLPKHYAAAFFFFFFFQVKHLNTILFYGKFTVITLLSQILFSHVLGCSLRVCKQRFETAIVYLCGQLELWTIQYVLDLQDILYTLQKSSLAIHYEP